MDINFQFGEFSSQESPIWTIIGLMVTFLGIVAGAGVSIYVFEKGKKAELEKEKERLDDIEKYVEVFVDELKNKLRAQIDTLKSIITKLASDDYQDFIVPSPILDARSINWISRNDLFKALVVKDSRMNSKTFWKTLEYFDYIDSFDTRFDRVFFKRFVPQIVKHETDWQTSLKALSRIRDRIQMEREVLRRTAIIPEYPFYNAMNEITQEWMRIDNFKNYPTAVEHFLRPLHEACNNTEITPDENVLLVLNHINDAIFAFDNMVKIRATVKEVNERMCSTLVKIATDLDEFFPTKKLEASK